ncbi:hypothetical protein [Actinomadura xylanilytica]|uniref:hypothetical protein n=1 Tax=Actinomadura xylanilytica TaxID=887459 RepID=UPI00255AD0D3|nr:hypothetical protein [Actinomadura xylanilytica]MDL4772486.1 hypothetical protein [Actinomadura xylanilytica]
MNPTAPYLAPVALGAQATKHAAETTAPRPITNLNEAPTHRPRRAGPAKRCPACRAELDGGPVHFRCAPCSKAVMAADLDIEYRAPDTTTETSMGRAAA